jgi:hypothetical protein
VNGFAFRMEDTMRTRALILSTAVAGGALLCACASSTDIAMEGRYEASLAQWKGVPEGQLLQGWGPPAMSADLPDGRMLVFVKRTDYVNMSAPQGYHTVSAFGAPIYVQGMTAAPLVPATCRTSFVLHQGVVSAWKFDGIGCGAAH